MRKYRFFMVLLGLAIPQLFAQSQQPFSSVEISFTFSRQSGYATNQYAIWIENAAGVVVKTLIATPFASKGSKGNWNSQGAPLPQWTKKTNLAATATAEIDAFTSATPATGKVSYVWDGTDRAGKKVDFGEYRVFIEVALRGRRDGLVRVVYSGVIRGDARGSLRIEEHYYDGNTEIVGARIPKEREMISGVTVTVK
jgi:hypothetical protein